MILETAIVLGVGIPINLFSFLGYVLWRNNATYNMRMRILNENSKLYNKLPPYDVMVSSFSTPLKQFEREARKKLQDEM